MLNTGFYNVVLNKEAERYLESKPERDKLRDSVQQHLREKGIDIELPSSKK